MKSIFHLYRLLPKTDCGDCKADTCAQYAVSLFENEEVEKCPHLTSGEWQSLMKLIMSPVNEVQFGPPDHRIKVGGERVLYRHEFKFLNPTPIFLSLDDRMSTKKIGERVAFLNDFSIDRVGTTFHLQGLFFEQTGSMDSYLESLDSLLQKYQGPLILSTNSLDCIKEALGKTRHLNPCLHTTEDVYSQIEEDVAVCLRSPEPFDFLDSDGLILEPVSESDLGSCLQVYTDLRKESLKSKGPALMARITEDDPMWATLQAVCFMNRYADLLVFPFPLMSSLLPLTILRQNLFSDPSSEPTVETGVYEINNPDESSPVLVTSNFALTFHNVCDDLEDAGISCYLAVIDTNGLAVTVSQAAGKISADQIVDCIRGTRAQEVLESSVLILPGVLSPLCNEIQILTGWEVIVGPEDSSDIRAVYE